MENLNQEQLVKTMELTIQERLLIGNLLPEKGNLITLTVARDISEKIKFTQSEIRECDLDYDEKLKTYSWKLNKITRYDFTPEEIKLLNQQISKLDQEEAIPLALFDLVKKIKEYK